MDMRKYASLFVLLVLIGSVLPAALAESGSGRDGDGRDDDSDNSGSDSISDLLDDNSNDSDDDSSDEYEIEVESESEVDGVRIKEREKIRLRLDSFREDAEQKREEIRAWRDERKEEIRATIDEFRTRRQALVEVKADLASSCRGNADSDVCLRSQDKFTTDAREFLIAATDRMLEHLDTLESYVLEHAEDELQETLLAEIDTVRVEVETAASFVKSLPDDATRDDLIEARKMVNDAWVSVKRVTQDVRVELIKSKVRLSFDKVFNVVDRLESARDDLEEAGADVTHLDELLVDLHAEIDAGKAAEDPTEAREHFSAAVQLVRDIIAEIKDLKLGLTVDAEVVA